MSKGPPNPSTSGSTALKRRQGRQMSIASAERHFPQGALALPEDAKIATKVSKRTDDGKSGILYICLYLTSFHLNTSQHEIRNEGNSHITSQSLPLFKRPKRAMARACERIVAK